jgi:cytochrome P450
VHLGKPLIGDHVRCLGLLDRLTKSRIRKTAKGIDNFLENTIEDHVKARRNAKYEDNREGSDLIDVLLNIQDNDEELGVSLSRNNIKAIILVCSLLILGYLFHRYHLL